MGLFTPNGYNVYSEPLDIENMTYEECAYENPFEAASYIVAETENNYNSIIKAMALDELAVYEATGQEMVYEAANFKAFFGKIKELFKKLWEKIKGMFQKFFAKINSLAMKDKDFVKKYAAALRKVDLKGFEYKGYTFTNTDKADLAVSQSDIEANTKSLATIKDLEEVDLTKYYEGISGDSLTNLLDTFRGKCVGKSSIEEGDFSDELFAYFRKGEDTKDTITINKVDDLLEVIKGYGDLKTNAEKMLNNLKTNIDKIIKDLDNAERSVEKSDVSTKTGLTRAYAATTTLLKSRMDILTLWSGAKLKAMKDENAQAKSICVKLLTYKPKNESAGFVHTEGGSYLDSVVFK